VLPTDASHPSGLPVKMWWLVRQGRLPDPLAPCCAFGRDRIRDSRDCAALFFSTCYSVAMWLDRAAIGLVAGHGTTDILLAPMQVLVSYALPLLLPPAYVTVCFWMASLSHLSREIGALGSTALHACLKLLEHSHRRETSHLGMLLYMSTVHVPAHYARVWRQHTARRRDLCALMVSSTLAGIALPRERTDICDTTVRRIIIGHVLCNRPRSRRTTPRRPRTPAPQRQRARRMRQVPRSHPTIE
jgi:hypothetical protein